MIRDETVKRRFTMIHKNGLCEISEGSKVIRTVPSEQAETIADLMSDYAHFFIVCSTPIGQQLTVEKQ